MEEDEDPGKPGKKVKDHADIIKQKMAGASPGKANTIATKENCVMNKTSDVDSSNMTNTENGSPVAKKIKLDKDVNNSDTAETIKKIQAFIALGKIEEANKDPEVPEKPAVETISKINLDSSEKQPKVVDSVKMNNINALQRTLQGLDDSQDNDLSEDKKSSDTNKDGIQNLATPLKEKTRDPRCGEGFIKINEMLTPSRVSKRIQSKTVKFSAKKLLRGDDSHLPKRKNPTYEKGKKMKRGFKKVKPGDDNDDSLDAEMLVDEPLSVNKSESEKSIAPDDNITVSPNASNATPKSQPSTKPQFANPTSPVSKKAVPQSESKDKSSLADKLGKFAVTNGKITLELKTAQKKKVVRIAVPPQTSPLPCTPASLGPDIIIKRVKPVKKTVVPETLKEPTKTFVEKELEQTVRHEDIPQLIKMSPKVRIERIPVKKLKNDIVRIQKNIIKSGKPDESKVMAIKCVQVAKPDGSVTDSDPAEEDKTEEANSHKVKNLSNDEPSVIQEVTQLLDSSKATHESRIGSTSQPGISSNKVEVKKRGRKPSRFTGDKGKSEYYSRKSERSRDFERSPSPFTDDEELEEDPPDRSPTLFDRYFTTTERYVEHHDSLDSDSSDDFDNKIYSHFINLKKNSKKKEEASVYDIMHDISIELPTWNIHASSSGEIFYLVQVDSLNDKPSMKKVVELDLDSNAKVYVDNKLIPEYEGNYSSYEDIRQLIYDIDQM